MKTRLLILCAACIACAVQHANATVWRVNNNGYSVDFAQLQDANDANNVVNGDTIHLEGSATSYESADITKRLVIIGSGYFLPYNPNTSFNRLSTVMSYISFSTGAQGSQITGVYFVSGFGISINTSSITIKRCRIDYAVSVSYSLTDIKIIQNFFSNPNNGTSSAVSASGFGFPTDFVFDNNICQRPLLINQSDYTFEECRNNIFDVPTLSPAVKFNAGTFYNNILTNPNATAVINNGDVTNVDYNISSSRNNQFGNSKNNIIATDTSTLFAGGTSPDGKYWLKSGSPAVSNGSDGTDRGVFGGGAPQKWYTLSGLAAIPVVYDISSSGVGSTGLPVTIKGRTIK